MYGYSSWLGCCGYLKLFHLLIPIIQQIFIGKQKYKKHIAFMINKNIIIILG